jgi:hypothetical protein
LEVLLLNSPDTLQHFLRIEHRLRGGEWIRCSGGWLAINEGKGIGANTKPLEVRSGKLEGNLTAIPAYIVDFKNGLGERCGHLVAYLWRWLWLRVQRVG